MPDAIIVARFLTGQCPGGGRNLAGGINVRYEYVSLVCEILLVKFLNGGGYCFNFAPSNERSLPIIRYERSMPYFSTV